MSQKKSVTVLAECAGDRVHGRIGNDSRSAQISLPLGAHAGGQVAGTTLPVLGFSLGGESKSLLGPFVGFLLGHDVTRISSLRCLRKSRNLSTFQNRA